MVRFGLVGVCLVTLASAGCVREPNWRNVESSITQQPVESTDYEYLVSPCLPFEDLEDHISAYRAAGWEVDKVTAAGKGCPGLYIVTYRH